MATSQTVSICSESRIADLLKAINKGQQRTITYLLNARSDLSSEELGEVLLHAALGRCLVGMNKALEKGADPNYTPDNLERQPVLYQVAVKLSDLARDNKVTENDVAVVQILLGADGDIFQRERHGRDAYGIIRGIKTPNQSNASDEFLCQIKDLFREKASKSRKHPQAQDWPGWGRSGFVVGG